MNIFLQNYHLTNLNQYQINNLNRPIATKEIESVIKRLPTATTQQQYNQDQMLLAQNSTRISKAN